MRCLLRRSLTLWFVSPGPLVPRWTSAPARCGSGGHGTASLCSSHWRPSQGPHTPQTAGWLHLQSIQPPPHPRPLHRQLPCHSLNIYNSTVLPNLQVTIKHATLNPAGLVRVLSGLPPPPQHQKSDAAWLWWTDLSIVKRSYFNDTNIYTSCHRQKRERERNKDRACYFLIWYYWNIYFNIVVWFISKVYELCRRLDSADTDNQKWSCDMWVQNN